MALWLIGEDSKLSCGEPKFDFHCFLYQSELVSNCPNVPDKYHFTCGYV